MAQPSWSQYPPAAQKTSVSSAAMPMTAAASPSRTALGRLSGLSHIRPAETAYTTMTATSVAVTQNPEDRARYSTTIPITVKATTAIRLPRSAPAS